MEIWEKLLSDLFSDVIGIASFSVIAITFIIITILSIMFIRKSGEKE